MANDTQSEIDFTAARETASRLCNLMEWPQQNTQLFQVWRTTGRGEALAIGLDKCNQVAAEIERLRAVAEYLERPDVLLIIPQPHRMELSKLLHGED